MQKSEEKRKISRSGKYVTISPLFFSYFPPIFLLLLHFSSTEEARAKNGSGLGLRKTRKGGWMRGTGQNGVVLGPTNKKKIQGWHPICNTTGGGRRRRRRRKRRRRRRSAYLVRPSEATQASALRLAGSERLVRLSGAFVKGCRLPSSKAPEGGVAPPRVRRAFQNYDSYTIITRFMRIGLTLGSLLCIRLFW